MSRQYSLLLILLIAFRWMPAMAQRQGPQKETVSVGSGRAAPEPGQQNFESRCARCHGLDGRGGEHGPDISSNPAVRQLHDEEMFRIVRDGIPTKGMPSFDFLPANQLRAVVNYLRSLGQGSSRQPLTGDPDRGKQLFFGKAGCGACHMMEGKGGFLASDLTGYGGHRAPGEIREGILNPARFHDVRRRALDVVTHKGERFWGLVRNEDNFSVQLLGADGAFHLLMKSEIEAMNRSSSPIMPDNYRKKLSSSELDDLVSYVAQSHRSQESGQKPEVRGRKPD